jgi:tRNA-dihydrouridine synthase B
MLAIGNLTLPAPLILAPMAAVTNPPFRKLCREEGAALVMTEMVSARGIIDNDIRSWRFVDLQPDEHPVSVQLFGAEPTEMAQAAALLQRAGADAVDINMGCPMKKIVRTGKGAALLREPQRAADIVRQMCRAVDIPVTVKMRAGWEETSAVDFALTMQDAGAAAITIHGRTRSDMYNTHADLGIIADVKRALSIPVIGNGDVKCHQSAERMFRETGCDAVMVARGCLGNPWVFREIRSWLDGNTRRVDRTPEIVAAMILRHFDLYLECFGEVKTCLDFRKHALWYFRDSAGEDHLRDHMISLRSASAMRQVLIDAAALIDQPSQRSPHAQMPEDDWNSCSTE